MNFLADESVDRHIVRGLRYDGHSVTFIAEIDPGKPDDAVLRLADQEGRILIV